MGWLEGLLTGYADRHYAIEKQKRDDAAAAAEREGHVFEALLNSDRTDIRDYAAAGMLDLANPRKRAGGIQGWMGEIEKGPYLDMIRRAKAQGEADPAYAQSQLRENYYPFPGTKPTGGRAPATPSIPTPAGSLPAAASPQGSAALPATSPVDPGAPPLQPATPAPTAATPPPTLGGGYQSPGPSPQLSRGMMAGSPPPQDPRFPGPTGLSAGLMSGAPPEPPAGPPIALPTPPPTPPTVGTGLPGGATAAVGQVAAAPRRRTQLPGIFPTAADLQRNQASATVTGKVDAYAQMYRMQGYSEQDAYRMAADLLERDLISSGSGNPYQSTRIEYTDPVTNEVIRTPATYDKATGRYLLPNGQPAPDNMRIITTGRLGQWVETAAQELGYPSATAVPEQDMTRVLQRAQVLEASFTGNRVEAQRLGAATGALPPEIASQRGLPFGTEGWRLFGQVLPTAEQHQRRLDLDRVKTTIDNVLTLSQAALPSEQDFQGMAPNLANQLRSRFTQRKEYAALQTQMDAIVNDLARSNGQRGPQTELDAVRAYNELVQFQTDLISGFTDPFRGDTKESAAVRMAQTKLLLDRALGTLPPDPTPTPGPRPTSGPQAAPGLVNTGGGLITPPAAAPASPAPGPPAPVTASPGFSPRAVGFDRDPVTGQRYVDGQPF